MKNGPSKNGVILLSIAYLLIVVYGCSPKHYYGLYSGLLMGEAKASETGPTLAEQLGYSKDSIVVIVHADDIGMHIDQTNGTFDAMKHGMVKTGSVMVPCPDFNRVTTIWKENPDLDLGIHLTLNSDWGTKYGWGPVLPKSRVPSLYSEKGIMWRTPKELMAKINVGEALRELEAQIRKVLKAGIKPTHMDAHYGNYYMNSNLAKGVMRLSRKYNLPMKPHREYREIMRRVGFVFPDSMWMFFKLYGERINPQIRKMVYDNWLRELQPGVHEIVIHSSFMNSEWADIVGSFNSYMRFGDYKYWSSPETKALSEELGIIFIGYRELQKLQAKNWKLSTDSVIWE